MERERTDTLVFALNGERFELSSIDPSSTLLEFLRTQTRFKSVKLGCGEGGCGACVVLLSKYDPLVDKVENFTVSSCLTLLCSVNGCSITTTEGLGNSKDGFHPIHQRFSGFHASQCGFCTPGMCVSLFSALINAESTLCPEPPLGFSKLTVAEAEKSIAGNLCRCTGYRPIVDACKSFACDIDMEDLGFNSFWQKGESNEAKLSKLPYYNPNCKMSTYPEFLKKEIITKMPLNSERCSWYSPLSIEELKSLFKSFGRNSKIKLVAGNTGTGFYKEVESYDKYIDIRSIPQFSMIRWDHTGIEIGATVTISKAILALKEPKEGEFSSETMNVFKKIANHMEKIASGFIRNSASVGGNLVMAQRNRFPSDIATVLLSVGTTVELLRDSKLEKLTIEDFLKEPALNSVSLLLSVRIPIMESVRKFSSESNMRFLFETYRAAPRPLGNALPYINAAFLAEISPSKTSNGIFLNNVQLAFGAYGNKHAIRAREVEKVLSGKTLTAGVFSEAVKLLKADMVFGKGISNPAYRESLAIGLLFEFFLPFIDTTSGLSSAKSPSDLPLNSAEATNMNGSTNIHGKIEDDKMLTLLSLSKQVIELNAEYSPVGEPITKSGASLQASGEAVYVGDIPSPSDCVHGAFIYCTKPKARIKSLKFKSKKSPPDGVIAILSVKDIPTVGENVGSMTMFGPEPLFADDVTLCAGQPIAFVVADTQKHADMAAALAEVDYEMENLEPPILTVEDAVEKSSFFDVPPILQPKQVGEFSKGMTEADHKILGAEIRLGSQYYFYMETQTALAVPDEDNCMLVYSSSQCPEYAHAVIAQCLGIPQHNVRVVTRRVGGGFGGKAIKSMPVATACALAAQKLQRPVRLYLNRKTDMVMAGGRHPMKITYDVGFKSTGKITALHLDILINAGISQDISPVMPSNMVGALKKYDWGALSFDIKVCKTNHSSKSAMRAPGEVQATFIAESVIEHVANTLSMNVDAVREINLHKFDSLKFFYGGGTGEPDEYTLPSIWRRLGESSSFDQRVRIVGEFNLCNRWRKRGLSRVPIVYEVTLRPTPGKVSILSDGSVVVEVGGIELGQGLWTKVKQMTAFCLSSIQCDGSKDLLEKVRVIQSDTLSLIQGGFTAGSTTSESSCEAVRLCCNMLVERLTPLKEQLKEQMGSVKWEVLIQLAHLQAMNMSASSFTVPEFTEMHYLNYGAAVSEVEVNLLTGETTILRSDIIYDCGQSLNPAVDLGQIEGAFVQGIGFFMHEEYPTNSDGLVVSEGTWTYKIPTVDTIPKQFNVHVLNSGSHQKRVLSSKASGEPPLLLAVSVHCATRAAIKEARKQLHSWGGDTVADLNFQLDVPATMPVVKQLCGLDIVERYLQKHEF